MAIINISFDTSTKKCSVSLNGQALNDVEGISIYKYKNYEGEEVGEIEVSMRTSEDDGMVKVTRLYASKEQENAESLDKLEDYANEKAGKIRESMSNWLCHFKGK